MSRSGPVGLFDWPFAGLDNATQGGEKLPRIEGGSGGGRAARPMAK